MTYKQKLIKIGNSVGIVVPKEVRTFLGIDTGSELHLKASPDKETIILSKKEPNTRVDPYFFDILKKVDRQYSSALKKIASK